MAILTGERQTFEAWLDTVDRLVERRTGVSVHDLPDCCFRDWYDAGRTPATAARRAIRDAKTY